MYGEGTLASTNRVWQVASNVYKTVFGVSAFRNCRAIDFGSGLGKVIAHFAAMFPESKGSLGLEFNQARVALFMAFLLRCHRDVDAIKNKKMPGTTLAPRSCYVSSSFLFLQIVPNT